MPVLQLHRPPRASRAAALAVAAAIALGALLFGCSGSGSSGGGTGDVGLPLPSGVLGLTARDDQFSTSQLTAPANTPFRIRLDNADDGIPHSLAIMSGSTQVWAGETFNGVASRTYDVPALAPGTYRFFCTVHLGMSGTLVVGP